VFEKLAYPNFFIEKAYNIAKMKITKLRKEEQKDKTQKIIVSYMPGTEKMKDLLPSNHKLTYSSLTTIKKIVVNTKPNNKDGTGVVYKIPCKNCAKQYIGETGNTIIKRIKEHKYDVAKANKNNAIFKHWMDTVMERHSTKQKLY